MSSRHLLPFFALSFAITWGIGAVAIGLPEALAARFGELDLRAPFWKAAFHLATYAPAISALVLVGAVRGRAGLRSYARGLLRWRAGLGGYAAVLLAYPALRIGGRALANLVAGEDVPLFAVDPWYAVVPLFLASLLDDPGPVEEIGWRGFALPLLQRRLGATGAGLVLGAIWGVWHLPAFFVSGMPQSAFAFPAFLLGSVALSLLMTAVYNSTGGNVILMFLMHAVGNFDYGVRVPGTSAEMVTNSLLALAVVAAAAARFGAERLGTAKVTRLPGEG